MSVCKIIQLHAITPSLHGLFALEKLQSEHLYFYI